MVGGNDCDSHNNDSRPVSDILEDYRLLIQDTKSKTHTVHVGSVCPRLKGQSVTDRIDSLNAGLQVMCNEEECTFINNDESFKLSNGAANDEYLPSDRVHLSYCGTNRLAKNLALTIKQGHNDVCRRSNHRAKSNSSHQLPGQKREGQVAQGTQWRPHTQKPPSHQFGTHRHDQTDRRNIQPVGVHATRVQWQHSHQASSPWQADAFIIGDLNINHLCDTGSKYLNDVMEINGLKNIIKEATCFKSNEPILIDVVLTTNADRVASTININTGLSDFHNLVGMATTVSFPRVDRSMITYRSYRKFDDDIFKWDTLWEIFRKRRN